MSLGVCSISYKTATHLFESLSAFSGAVHLPAFPVYKAFKEGLWQKTVL